MHPVLKTALHLLWRDPGSVQLGVDPERAVVVQGLEPAERALLSGLDGSLDTVDLERSAARAGLVPERARALLALLLRAGALDDLGARAAPLAGWRGDVRARLAPDLASLSLLHPARTDGATALLEARSRRWVEVHGAGRVGAGVARLLAASGVGRVTVEDPARAGAADVSPLGLPAAAVGMPRGRAAEIAAAADTPLAERPAARASPDLAVLAGAGRPDQRTVDALVRAGVPHLLAGVRETVAVVGPLVVPGVTSCLRCLDLHRRDRDPGWPVLVAQLMAGGPDVEPCDTALAALGSAAAAAQVLANLDGARDGPARDGALEYSLPHGLLRRRSWSAHPLCGCRWVQ
ncbi:hypothetical protein [Motilibacter peucedani]|uniref:hypothetical protein n=1 Tax=Motilibacter peucedani TaxID=598650 RepID=UPI000EB146D3|nr:hypothetical protein [Motilibacter peucedani]